MTTRAETHISMIMEKNDYFDRPSVIAFLDDAKRITGKTLSRLGKDAKIAHSTVTRYYNDPEPEDDISLKSLNKIAQSIGYKSYADYVTKKAIDPEHMQSDLTIEERVRILEDKITKLVNEFTQLRKPQKHSAIKSDA